MEQLRSKKGFICDMDGVIYHGNKILPGVTNFVNWLYRENKNFIFLTNSSQLTPREYQQKLANLGIMIDDENRFYTSALATAEFIRSQNPRSSAYVIGAGGLMNALYDAGITNNDRNPDYVIVGETDSYNYSKIVKAVTLVNNGARLIGTNTDITGPMEFGLVPACKSLISPIEIASGKKAYFVGKPNPLIMRTALRLLNVHSEEAAIIGDRMDSDIIAGIETGLDTCLVLSGVTDLDMLRNFSYAPRVVANNVGEVAEGNEV